MKPTRTPAKRKRRASRPPPAATEPTFAKNGEEGRAHGDSYSDVVWHEDPLVGTSAHVSEPSRRSEEPAEAALGAPDRLEGNT